MAQKDRAALTTQAQEIKNETTDNANTATRVGTMLEDLVDSQNNIDDDGLLSNKEVVFTSCTGSNNPITLPTRPLTDFTYVRVSAAGRSGASITTGTEVMYQLALDVIEYGGSNLFSFGYVKILTTAFAGTPVLGDCHGSILLPIHFFLGVTINSLQANASVSTDWELIMEWIVDLEK